MTESTHFTKELAEMPSSMLVHDLRLAGSSPRGMAAKIYEVNDRTPIHHAITIIGDYARRSRGLTDLFVMCHGYEADWDLRNLQCTGKERGGFGLCLCKEGLTLRNVSLTSALKNLIGRITLYACAPADTAPFNAGTQADGRRLCGEMALWTQAEVIAAVQTQYYVDTKAGGIDFGLWEGPVMSFSPKFPNGRQINANQCSAAG